MWTAGIMLWLQAVKYYATSKKCSQHSAMKWSRFFFWEVLQFITYALRMDSCFCFTSFCKYDVKWILFGYFLYD